MTYWIIVHIFSLIIEEMKLGQLASARRIPDYRGPGFERFYSNMKGVKIYEGGKNHRGGKTNIMGIETPTVA